MDPKLEAVVQKTIKILKKTVKKTPLTPKLLGKPPFRYLHDLISEVIRNTGFAKDLYNDEEKQSTNKDKEGKINYLTKMINVVGIITNQSLKVNPLKVVAGMEPDQTNIFLQLLGESALTKVEESKDVVKRVLAGETMKKPQKAGATRRSSDPKLHSSNSRLSTDSKDKSVRGSQSHTSRSESNKKTSGSINGSTSSLSKHQGGSNTAHKRMSNGQATSKVGQKSSDGVSHRSSNQNLAQGSSKKSSHESSSTSNNANGNGNSSGSNSHHQRNINDSNAAAASKELDKDTSSSPNDDSKKIMNAPSNGGSDNASSNTNSNNDSNNGNDSNGRPGNNSQQPQRGNKGGNANDGNGGINENIPEANADDQIDMAIEQEAVVSHIIANSRYRERPASARPPPPKQRHSNIIQDTPVKVATPIVIQETSQQQDEEEENEYFIINQDNQEMNKPILSHDDTKGNDHFGGLVQHILDTKKDLEGGDSNEKDSSLKLTANENESKDMIHAKKDINSLRESIQFLCRNTNPLGKTMDYIQEDFDSMIKELEGWKSESVKYSDLLKTELETTKETLKPLQEQLREVEQNIAEELERINSQNATIIRNKEKIDKLLQSIVHAVR